MEDRIVHRRGSDGKPLCRCGGRWLSKVFTTTWGWSKVTCRTCLRMRPAYDNAPTDPHHGGKIWSE